MQETLKHLVVSDGVSLCYRRNNNPGAGTAVVLIHGLASNMTRWTEFVEHTGLSDSSTIIRIDLRGHGCSLCRKRIRSIDWVDDLYALMEQEQLDKIIIVGHSLGAQVGMHFARQYPQRVCGLILIDPVFPEALQGTMFKLKRYRWLVWMASMVILFFNKLGIHRRKFEYRDLHELDKATRKILAASEEADIADLYMSPLADLKYIPWSVYLQELSLVVGSVPPPEQIESPVRVLLSAGASTSALPAMRAILARFPNVAIREIDADHWLLTEKPVEGREAIEAFCAELLGRN